MSDEDIGREVQVQKLLQVTVIALMVMVIGAIVIMVIRASQTRTVKSNVTTKPMDKVLVRALLDHAEHMKKCRWNSTVKGEVMNCPNCDKEMVGVCCWDDDQVTDHAHNVAQCDDCGVVVHERVANDAGATVIYPDGKVVTQEPTPCFFCGEPSTAHRDRWHHKTRKRLTPVYICEEHWSAPPIPKVD